jgi:hypothetical protein
MAGQADTLRMSSRSRTKRKRRAHSHPEAREDPRALQQELERLAARKVAAARAAEARGEELPLFPRPESGPTPPGTRRLDEIADLEERFAEGELTWMEYSRLLRELAPPAEG